MSSHQNEKLKIIKHPADAGEKIVFIFHQAFKHFYGVSNLSVDALSRRT